MTSPTIFYNINAVLKLLIISLHRHITIMMGKLSRGALRENIHKKQ